MIALHVINLDNFKKIVITSLKGGKSINLVKDILRNRILEAIEAKRLDKLRKQVLVPFKDKYGLEIGGPSKIFSEKGLFPIYSVAKLIDCVNFSEITVWGKMREDKNFEYTRGKIGYLYISEATDLKKIDDEKYDFVLSSHVIEHIANPIKALYEWKRVIRAYGFLFLIVPNKRYTFDHKRPVTPFEHIIKDFENETTEDDLTHLPEILRLHDLSMDYGVAQWHDFFLRSIKNYEYRCLHHHTFIPESVVRLLDYIKMRIIFIREVLPCHIVALVQKLSSEHHIDNSAFLTRV